MTLKPHQTSGGCMFYDHALFIVIAYVTGVWLLLPDVFI
jgi:hypothetical protein